MRGILGELSKIDYVGYWDDINEEYKKTDEVERFSYGEEKGRYEVKQSYDGNWYLGYLLRARTLETFDCLDDDCKIKVFDWYTCCDMPVEF